MIFSEKVRNHFLHYFDRRAQMNKLPSTPHGDSERRRCNDVAKIRDAMLSVAADDYTVRISDSISCDEFAELATAFDAMAEKLAANTLRLSHIYEATAASERIFRELVEKANSIILKWDSNGSILYLNGFAETFFGFSTGELIGSNIIGTIVPETETSGRDLVKLMGEICKNPAAFINNKNENMRKNGDRVWVSWNNHPLVSADGKIEEILSVGQDITESIKIKEKLMKSEQRFRSFVENVNDVLFALTPLGIFSYVSPQWKVAFGYEISETIGKPFVPFVHPDDVAACFEFLQLVVTTGQKQSGVEYRVLCKNGLYLWYTANASLITDPVDGSLMLVAIGRDITERKLAEEALRLSEEKFSAAFRSSPDAITITRLSDNVFLEVNDGFTAITGYCAKEVVGRSPGELSMLTDSAQETDFLRDIEGSGAVNNAVTRFRRKDGSEFSGQISARIVNIYNEPHVLAVTRDITDRELIQKELLKAQKLESISVLAGGIAHNFNNVLTGVIGYISFAKKHLGDPEKVLNLLESAEKSSYRAAALARQLLQFSRGGSPVKKPVFVDELVQESVSLFLTGTNVSGSIDCHPHQAINADAQQISQAFNNIILNAVHAMPDGGTLEVRVNGAKLTTGNRHSLPAGDYVEIVFADSGCGIRKEDLHKIYDPYFTTKDSGTGLGLSTAFSIINRHNGRIEITSDLGKNTRVTILLPSFTDKPAGVTASAKRAELHRKDISILVMDDEAMIRDLVADLLDEQGYGVKTCATGEAAVALYAAAMEEGAAYSLVILDLIIQGGMGGVQAAKLILAHNPQAILVVSSGYADDPAVEEYGKYGFSGAIMKPYSAKQLEETIKQLLPPSPLTATI